MKNEPIRVLQVVPNMNAGGLETLIMNLYRNIDREKVQFDFLVHYKGEFFFSEEIRHLGGKIYHLSVRNDNNVLKYLIDLSSFFKKHHEYNVIHGHMVSTAIFYLYFAKRNGVSFRIIHSHNTNTNNDAKGFLKKILAKTAPIFANKYMACGDLAGKALFGRKNFFVINNGVETGKFKYDKKERVRIRQFYNLQDSIVIGHVGRFTMQKNHKFLLNVFAQIYEINKNAVLLLVGDGELKEKVFEQAKKLGISEYILYMGIRNDMEKIYQAMDVFVLPSFFEGFPVVAIECQSAGLPMIVSNSVSKEIAITPLVEFHGLDESETIWAEAALRLANSSRRDYSYEVKNAGYDIKREAHILSEMYLNANDLATR